jgi:hypothetical protein
MELTIFVVPAKAGTQGQATGLWPLGSRFRGNDGEKFAPVKKLSIGVSTRSRVNYLTRRQNSVRFTGY